MTAKKVNFKLNSEKLFVAPYSEVRFLNGNLHVGFGSIGCVFTTDESVEAALNTISFFGQGNDRDEFKRVFMDEIHENVASKMIQNNILVSNTIDSSSRHSRSLYFYMLSGAADPAATQEMILKSKVCLIGCGGIGVAVASNLVMHGLGDITLIDGDVVEWSNLNRQFLFTEQDVGKNKALATKQALEGLNSEIKITVIPRYFDKNSDYNLIENASFVFVAADEAGINQTINDICIRNKKPMLTAGYINDIAVWGPFVIPGETGCWRCHSHIAKKPDQLMIEKNLDAVVKINASHLSPGVGPLSMIAASFASLDVIKFLGNFGIIASKNKRIGIWTHDMHIEVQDYSKNEHCTVCGDTGGVSNNG